MMEERNLSRLTVRVYSYSLPVQTPRELGREGKENDDGEGGGGREGKTAGGTALAALFVNSQEKAFLWEGSSARLPFMLPGSYSPMCLMPILLFLSHARGYWNQ